MSARIRWRAGLALLAPSLASAHVLPGGASAAGGVGTTLVVLLLLVPALLYGLGLARLRGGPAGASTRNGRIACFTAGELALAACLLSPLDRWSATLFSWHMVQHELLMLVAAPLLVLGRPLPVFLWAFPERARQSLARWTRAAATRAAWRALMHPATGWLSHALALWAWHIPILFRAALRNPVLHDLQHLSFVLTALLFWSGLFLTQSAARRGAAVLYLFTTTVHTGVLGALITLAGQPLYAPGLRAASLPGALQDQQLGGLIMWVPGSMIYVGAGLILFLQWIRLADKRVSGT
jgi:putative membrane protein